MHTLAQHDFSALSDLCVCPVVSIEPPVQLAHSRVAVRVAFTIPVLVIPYVCIYRRVRVAARDSRRMEAAACSPVYSHFGDTTTTDGRATIRAFMINAEARFVAQNLARIEVQTDMRCGAECA